MSQQGASIKLLPSLLLALFCCLALLTGCQREETREEKRAKMWKEDSKACDKFATKRAEARKLLAYDPEAEYNKTLQDRLAEAKRAVETVVSDLKGEALLFEADRRACLRGQGWKDEWIDELEAKDSREADERAGKRKKGLPR